MQPNPVPIHTKVCNIEFIWIYSQLSVHRKAALGVQLAGNLTFRKKESDFFLDFFQYLSPTTVRSPISTANHLALTSFHGG